MCRLNDTLRIGRVRTDRSDDLVRPSIHLVARRGWVWLRREHVFDLFLLIGVKSEVRCYSIEPTRIPTGGASLMARSTSFVHP